MDYTNLTKHELHNLLLSANNAYYTNKQPILSDSEYDTLSTYYYNMYGDNIKPDTSLTTTANPYPILATWLRKISTKEKLYKWLSSFSPETKFRCSPKYDGISLIVCYDEHGTVELAITRGDENTGTDVTRFFKNHKNHFNVNTSKFAVKYELVLPKSSLYKINSHHNKTYKNCRNAIAGILNRKDSYLYYEYTKLKPISVKYLNQDFNQKYSDELLHTLFTDFDDFLYTSSHCDIESYIDNINCIRNSVESNIQYDGVVIDVIDTHKPLTITNNLPEYTLAYKLDAPNAESFITGIYNSIGKSGAITPIVLINPVIINGNVYSKVSYHTWGRVIKDKLGVGDKVLLELKGDIIPYITIIDSCSDNKFKLPFYTHATFDNGILVNIFDNINEQVVVSRCCSLVKLLDFKGIGKSVITKLIRAGILNNYYDILFLNYSPDNDIKNILLEAKLSSSEIHLLLDYVSKFHTNSVFTNGLILKMLLIDGLGNSTCESIAKLVNGYNIATLILNDTNTLEQLVAGSKYETKLKLIKDNYQSRTQLLEFCSAK